MLEDYEKSEGGEGGNTFAHSDKGKKIEPGFEIVLNGD